MANEFVHGSVGTSMTQAEFEAVGLHVCNSQATGDLIYASSASQLSRLAIGSTRAFLQVVSGIPSWQTNIITADSATFEIGNAGTIQSGATNGDTALFKANDTTFITLTTGATNVCTLANITMSGTWLASGTVTLPAHTSAQITSNVAGAVRRDVDDSSVDIRGGLSTTSGFYRAYGKDTAGLPGALLLSTPDAALAAATRLTITGAANTAIASWTTIAHAGFVLGGNMIGTGYNITGLVSITSMTGYQELTEMAAPAAGAANTARVYAVVDGGALTDLAAVFQDGTVDIFAQEVTPLDSPLFRLPSKTEAKVILRKPHPGKQIIEMVFADGSSFVLKEIEHHDAEKIAATIGCEEPLPQNWLVETKEERDARVAKEAKLGKGEN